MPVKKSPAKAKKSQKTSAGKSRKPAKKPSKPRKAAASAARPAARKTTSSRKTARKPAKKPARIQRTPAPAKAAKRRTPTAATAAPATSRRAVKPSPRQPDHDQMRPAPVAEPLQSEIEDTDADYNPNLLAGPRNVQPYIPRRGEQYMNKEQLDHFRSILFTWKRDLMVEVDRTVLHMKDEAANFPDPNDRATQESEFSLELRTRDRERKLIRKIDEALKRIDDGSYGYCIETGEEIGIKRLEARPVATLCVEAQERRERREKQYGDRDDRYR